MKGLIKDHACEVIRCFCHYVVETYCTKKQFNLSPQLEFNVTFVYFNFMLKIELHSSLRLFVVNNAL